ncbi:hypothetical protein C1Y22_36730, partial [Pseudomonas sp. MPR-R2A5]
LEQPPQFRGADVFEMTENSAAQVEGDGMVAAAPDRARGRETRLLHDVGRRQHKRPQTEILESDEEEAFLLDRPQWARGDDVEVETP